MSEVAPGTFMRDLNGIYGSNQIFIEFDEYVVVFDSSCVDQGKLLQEEIRARTDKPIRYVIHSHFHPDHTAGAAFLAKSNDVEILAGIGDYDAYENWGRKDFAKKRQADPELYRDLEYPAPTRYLEQTEIFDDGHQRLEIIHFGHAHTMGDLVGWLPKHGILLTGDVCENQAYYNLANANIAGWIRVLDSLRSLPVEKIVPGHGHVGDSKLLDITRRYFVELRGLVAAMVSQGMPFEDVLRDIEIPFYEDWTGTAVNESSGNIKVVYTEVGGVLAAPKKRYITKKRLAVAILVSSAVVGIGLIHRWRMRQLSDQSRFSGE